MKKSILIALMLAFVATVSMVAQPQMHVPFNNDTTKYVNVISLSLENAYWHSDKEIKVDGVQLVGDNDYLSPLPKSDSIVIKTNWDNTKAKIVKGAPFDYLFSFNVIENERRIVLYYEDNRVYFGYTYDKYFKACRPFREIKQKEFRRRMNGFGFRFRR